MIEVVEDAFEEIGVKTAEIPLTDDELQAGIRRCNDMLTEWDDLGIIVGYNPVLLGDDVLEVDRSALGAIKLKLAIRLAPSFQKPITAALAANAEESFNRLEASGAYIPDTPFPDTLPIGSGNECPDSHLDDRFFNANKKENF
jgi:hypothetical protein